MTRFSVIIPTHNRVEQLRLTLAAFDLQNYAKDQFEVIVVDDGSTDDTAAVVPQIRASYPLRFAQTKEKHRGRSQARNVGISQAKGRYLLFVDADFLVIPELLQVFWEHHQHHRRSVISGIPHSWNKVYTQFYPNFSPNQKNEMHEVLSPHGLWDDAFWDQRDGVIEIMTRDHVYRDYRMVERLLAPDYVSQRMRDCVAQTDVAPWLMFVTRCVSVAKTHVLKVGGFDTDFRNWGLEDWELGYRLHKHGLSFVSVGRTMGYHQEHPRGAKESQSHLRNLRVIYDKHGFDDPQINLLRPTRRWSVRKYKRRLRRLARYEREGRHKKAARLQRRWKRRARAFYRRQLAPLSL